MPPQRAKQAGTPWKIIGAIVIAAAVAVSVLYFGSAPQSQSYEFISDGQKQTPSELRDGTAAAVGKTNSQQSRVDGEIVDVQAPENVDEGQTARIHVTVMNTGNVDATFRVQVGELMEETFLAEGDSQTLNFDLTPGRGNNNITVSLYDNERRLDQQHVQLSVLYLDGEITCVEVPANLEEGQQAMAHITIKNTGNKGGMFKVFLKGSNIFYNETWVSAGDSQTLSIAFTTWRWDSNVVFSLCGDNTVLDNTQQSIVVSHEVTLQITDNETDEAVGLADVYVDGELKGRTTQSGRLDVDLSPGRYRVGIEVAGVNGRIEEYITVGENDEEVSLVVDLPNPVFLAGMKVGTHRNWWQLWLDEVGDAEVTLANMGEMSSENTMAVLFVYFEDDLAVPVATRVLNFGNIAPGDQVVRRVDDMYEFRNIKSERAIIVVFDGWKYTPNGEVIGGEVTVPMGELAQLVSSALDYLQQHPEVMINAAIQLAGFIV
jgi:hypothetical protein